MTSYTLTRSLPFERVSLLLRPYASYNELPAVQEYQPAGHRLRLSTSA